MVNHPGTLKFKGGDLTQMRKTAEALLGMGIECGESFDPEPDGRGFDIAHVFNIRTVAATSKQVAALRRQGLPIVMSPIYLDPSVALWANRSVMNVFRAERTEGERKALLDQLASRTLRVKAANGATFAADTRNRPDAQYDVVQRQMLKNISALLPNSVLELDRMIKALGPFEGRFAIVPYACDPRVFLDPDPEPFVRKYGLRDFVLQVGRIELSKNQLLLCYALRELDIPLVLIGSNQQTHYLDWCRRYGPKSLKVISHLPAEELRSAYAAARVHVLPSWIETCGLVTMEAALADCNCVVSTAGYELEYYADLVYYCDPADVRSICSTVVRAYDQYEHDAQRRQMLRDRILNDYSWERAARICRSHYEAVLADGVRAS
jgi:glycosyltransferase involved in cell wall biosynthesis